MGEPNYLEKIKHELAWNKNTEQRIMLPQINNSKEQQNKKKYKVKDYIYD